MPRLENEIAVAADPADVWKVLGNLEATPEWIPGIVEAKIEGDLRVCRTADGQEIHEEVERSDADRTITYRQSRVPLPITDSHGTLTVVPDGRGSRVRWIAEFEAAGDVVAMVDGYYAQTLDTLKKRIEDGSG